MDNLGDLLYLVAMLAFFVISAVVKSRKKKQSEAQAIPDDEQYEQKEDVLQDLRDLFQAPKTPQIEKQKPATVQNLQTTYAKQTKIEPKRTSYIKSVIDKKNDPPVLMETKKANFWDEEEFDLKKAIVFSEILKRPDY